jgi:hypothetical protein
MRVKIGHSGWPKTVDFGHSDFSDEKEYSLHPLSLDGRQGEIVK